MDYGYGVQKHNFDLDIFQFDENIKYLYFSVPCQKIEKCENLTCIFHRFGTGFSLWYIHRYPHGIHIGLRQILGFEMGHTLGRHIDRKNL